MSSEFSLAGDNLIVRDPAQHLYPKLVVKVGTVTPELAADWLTSNVRNRDQREGGFAAYSRDMRDGDWLLNGDTIKFDWDGNLLDGQHRLLGCITSGESFDTIVVWGLDPKVQPTVDTGMTRHFRDRLKMGIDDPNASEAELELADLKRKHSMTIAALTRRVHMWDTGERIYFNKGKITGTELAKTLEANDDIVPVAQYVDQLRDRNQIHASTLSFLLWQLQRANKELAYRFVDKLTSGADLRYGNPILVLRARISKERADGKNNLEPLTIWLTMYTWNAWLEGRILTKLQLAKGGMTQENFPLLRREPLPAFYAAHDLARLDKEPVVEEPKTAEE